MIRIREEVGRFVADVKNVGAVLWHNHGVQAGIVLTALPWLAVMIYRRSLNVWQPLAVVLGIIFVYWFFTRGQSFTYLPIRRPAGETILALSLVALWMLYRIAEYMRAVVFPPTHVGLCDDLMDTIVPKMIEMVVLPLILFLALRYSLPQLGLGLPVRAWIPALLPLLALTIEGVSHIKPDALLTRTFCFYLGAGLPEELLFRGLLQPRLELLLKRPEWGLFLGAFIFGVTHLPIDLHGSGLANWETALESAFTYQMTIGLALGFAIQRSRNLWPLTLIHALIDSAPMVCG